MSCSSGSPSIISLESDSTDENTEFQSASEESSYESSEIQESSNEVQESSSELQESSNELQESSSEITKSSEDQGSSEDEEGSGDEEPANPLDEPLYSGAKLSVIDSYMKIMKYSLRHSLTKQALGDLLSLLDEHLPVSSMISVHRLRKLFLQLYEDMSFITHHCCSNCHSPLENSTSLCRHGCTSSPIEFLQILVEPQLQRKFQGMCMWMYMYVLCCHYCAAYIIDPMFWKLIQQRLATPRDSSSLLQDLYDGSEYRRHKEFLSSTNNISFMLNTDGAQLFSSSTISLWPIWLVINELPPQVRFSKKNVILAGIWFSRDKPTMTTYLAPVIAEINKLTSQGIQYYSSIIIMSVIIVIIILSGFSVKTADGVDRIVRARLLLCSVDLPARALVLNMKQFNGEYGCCYCKDKGVTRPTSSLHRNWPYTATNTMRTHQDIICSARTALQNKTHVSSQNN